MAATLPLTFCANNPHTRTSSTTVGMKVNTSPTAHIVISEPEALLVHNSFHLFYCNSLDHCYVENSKKITSWTDWIRCFQTQNWVVVSIMMHVKFKEKRRTWHAPTARKILTTLRCARSKIRDRAPVCRSRWKARSRRRMWSSSCTPTRRAVAWPSGAKMM